MPYTLVTGSAKGIGREICLHLARQGRNVIVHYRKSEREAQALCEELRKLGVQAEMVRGDLSSLSDIETWVQKCPEVDGLINNVGDYLVGSALETSPRALNELFQTSVTAPLALAQAFLPSLRKNQGAIVNMGMVGCHLPRANTHAAFYNLCKTALWQLTLSLAKELAPSKVTVNMVSPGYLENSIDHPSSLEQIPMRRLGDLDEVAHAVAFFLNPKSRYITGQNLEVAGGFKL